MIRYTKHKALSPISCLILDTLCVRVQVVFMVNATAQTRVHPPPGARKSSDRTMASSQSERYGAHYERFVSNVCHICSMFSAMLDA